MAITAPEDLIFSKLYWARDSRSEMQLQDVKNLIETVSKLNKTYTKDTSPEITLCFREMLMKKSGQERLQMGFSMYDLARDQVTASLKVKASSADSREMRKWIFLRFYGQDFTLEMREKILEYLDKYEEPTHS